MKQRDRKRFITGIFSFLLILLGFSTCDSPEDMYGTPIANFTIKGKVRHISDKDKLLEDIRVVVYPLPEEYGKYNADTLFTDKYGVFELHSQIIGPPKIFRIIYEEQQEKVGEIPLKKGQVDVIPKQVEKGDGAWYIGKYEVEVEIAMENEVTFTDKE